MPPKVALDKVLTTADALLTQYLEALPPSKAIHVELSNPPPPLSLLSDSARLLKAQVTKLSLLAINKPFTPSAISAVLQDTTTTCLPAMMSAVQICDNQQSIFGGFFSHEVRARVRRVMREMQGLVREVSSIAASAQSSNSNNAAMTGRDSLSSTGIVWSGCDELVSLANMGVAGLAVQKAEAYRAMIKDAITELQEWREGDDTENEGFDESLLDSDDEGVDGDRDSLDGIFNAANSLPADRMQLKILVEEAEDKLKKVVILYTAIVKRRLKDFPKQPTLSDAIAISRLQSAMTLLQNIPEMVDEMASHFYDLEEDASKTSMHTMLGTAMKCAELFEHDSAGNEDTFTAWLTRWKEAIINDSRD